MPKRDRPRDRVPFTTTILPMTHDALVARAISRYGRANRVNRVIEELMSKPYEATTQQASDPVLKVCWHDRLTESETIEQCREAMVNLRQRINDLETEIEQLRGDR